MGPCWFGSRVTATQGSEGQTGNAGPNSRVTAKYDRSSEDIARNIEAQEQLLLQIQV